MGDEKDGAAKAQVKPAYAPRGGSAAGQPRATRMSGRPIPAQPAAPSPARADPEAGQPRVDRRPAMAGRPPSALPEPAAAVPVAPSHQLPPPRHFDPRDGIMDFVAEYADRAATYAHVAGQHANIGDSRECLRSLKMFYAVAKQLVAQVDDLEAAIEEYGKDDLEALRYPTR